MKRYYSTANSSQTCLVYPTPSRDRCPGQAALSFLPRLFTRAVAGFPLSRKEALGEGRPWRCCCWPRPSQATAARPPRPRGTTCRLRRWEFPSPRPEKGCLAHGHAAARGQAERRRGCTSYEVYWAGTQRGGMLGGLKKPGDHLSLAVLWLIFDEPNNINKWAVFAKVMLLRF